MDDTKKDFCPFCGTSLNKQEDMEAVVLAAIELIHSDVFCTPELFQLIQTLKPFSKT